MKRLAVAVLAVLLAAQALAQEAPPPPPAQPGYPPQQAYPPPQGYPPPPAYPPQQGGYYRAPYQRDSWYIGFGVGLMTAGGRYTIDSTTFDFGEGLSEVASVSLNFKVGATVTPRLLVGFDITGIRTQGKAVVDSFGNKLDLGTQVTNYDAMVTWFPMERGLFLRGGAGLAVLSQEAEILGVRSTNSVSGVGAVLGAGYAFWLGRSFNLTLNLDVSGQSYGSSANKPSSSSAVNFFVGFDWY